MIDSLLNYKIQPLLFLSGNQYERRQK